MSEKDAATSQNKSNPRRSRVIAPLALVATGAAAGGLYYAAKKAADLQVPNCETDQNPIHVVQPGETGISIAGSPKDSTIMLEYNKNLGSYDPNEGLHPGDKLVICKLPGGVIPDFDFVKRHD